MHRSVLISSVLLASLATGLSGCATDTQEDDLSTSSTEQDLSGNQKAAFDYFVARGLTKRQSAGIVGNLIQESSVIPTAKEYGGGPGRGIAQWSTGGRWNHSYHDNVVWYAGQHNESSWALKTQLAFTWYELHTVGGYGLGAIRASRTIKGSVIAFEKDFEICGTCDQTRRYTYAKQVYNAYAGDARLVDIDDEDANDVVDDDLIDNGTEE